jgi:exodeoxyribonuclease V alpha subunit
MPTELPFADPLQTGGTTITGAVKRVVYSNPENAWSVIRLVEPGRGEPITAVGSLLGVQPGEELRLTGEWVTDRKYGRQFRVTSCLTLQPSTLDGIKKYLGSGLIPGIGKVMAERLVTRFGLETLEVIADHPGRLSEVDGIGSVRARRIRAAWQEQEGLREALIALQALGISTHHAIKIYKQFGPAAVATVKQNPFRLATEIFGIGFKTADQIAARIGLPPDSPDRVVAGLLYVLGQGADKGHIYLPRPQLVEETSALLEVEPELVERCLENTAKEGGVVTEPLDREQIAVFRPELHAAEVGTARRLRELLAHPASHPEVDLDRALAWFEQRHELQLAPEQGEAIRRALTSKLLVITGGPGTGKTTLVRAVVQILTRKGRRLALAAPTGRAAKRLAEATGAEAKTIHRLLEFDPRSGVFQRQRQFPLEADTLVVDEASMLDCQLIWQLLEATPNTSEVVLVGDVDQLPSVGPGRVLADLIDSGQVPVVELTKVFRQAAESSIVRNAHRIRRGELPELTQQDRDSDFFFINRKEPDEIIRTLEHLVTERIPGSFGFDPRAEIQILTPMRRGLLGTENLNRMLQELLNPDGAPVEAARGRLRAGDRVMQIRNNYDLEVFNGDIGRIAGTDKSSGQVHVDFDRRRVEYEPTDLDELTLAYACSVHKSQGSEYPCVILPIHTQHYILLQRNLLYTAVTRGQRLVVLVGDPRALAVAVSNAKPQARFTRLAQRLAARA